MGYGMRPGFMSSVCPKQTLSELIKTAKEHGYEGLEFRVEWGHGHCVELTASFDELGVAQGMLEDNGIEATCIATGVKLNTVEESDHQAARESMMRYVELAQNVGAPFLRVFADKVPEDQVDTVLKMAAESCAAVDDHAGQHGVAILIETHTNMRPEWAKRIVTDSGGENIGVLWHIGHHLSRGQSVDDAWAHISDDIGHVHFSAREEGKADDDENKRTFELLGPAGYDGFFSVEVINPDDSEAVLKSHSEKFNRFKSSIS